MNHEEDDDDNGAIGYTVKIITIVIMAIKRMMINDDTHNDGAGNDKKDGSG